MTITKFLEARIAMRHPNGEPEWLKRATRTERFMHYTPVEAFMVCGSLIGGAVGLGLFLLARAVL